MTPTAGYTIRQLGGTLAVGVWTPLAPSTRTWWSCLRIVNESNADLRLRTTVDDPLTEITIVKKGGSFEVQTYDWEHGSRFLPEVASGYVQPASGDGTGVYVVWY